MFQKLYDIFSTDTGGTLYGEDRRQLEENLTPQIREWLGKLSDEDLTNVCIGECRIDEATHEDLWLIGGRWQPVPDYVTEYLESFMESFG